VFGARIRSDFIEGMGKVKGRLVILLDLNQALAMDELDTMTSVASAVQAEVGH